MIKRQSKPVQLTDIRGKRYQTTQDELLEAARRCVREQFSDAAGITSPDEAKDQLQILLGHYEHEVFYAVWLNTCHQIIHHGELFRGTIDGASVYPREVVKTALACNAAAVIFAHNHPSGSPEPSSADREITRRLKEALSLFDIRVLDHFIIGRDAASLAERGLI